MRQENSIKFKFKSITYNWTNGRSRPRRDPAADRAAQDPPDALRGHLREALQQAGLDQVLQGEPVSNNTIYFLLPMSPTIKMAEGVIYQFV